MSTTYITVHDLLRITYTYEAQAIEAHAEARSRSSSQASVCSVSAPPLHLRSLDTGSNLTQTPDLCSSNSSSPVPASNRNLDFATLETDFTPMFARKKRDSGVLMT